MPPASYRIAAMTVALLTAACASTGSSAPVAIPTTPAEPAPVASDTASTPSQSAGCTADTAPVAARIAGSDRIDTAVQLAAQGWGAAGAPTVALASARAFPDALAATPWAAAHDAPLLLTEPGELPDTVRGALERLGTTKAVLVGGPSAIGKDVADALAEDGIEVERLAGDDRFATAAVVAADIHDAVGDAVLVTGRAFPDAVAAGPLATTGDHHPILLTETGGLPTATSDVLEALGVERVSVVGGPAAISEQVLAQLRAQGIEPTRIAGADRYATSAAVVAEAQPTNTVAFVTGRDFPDALAANAYAARRGATVLLVDPADLIDHPSTGTALATNAAAWRCTSVVGGTSAVGVRVAEQLAAATGAWPPDGDPVLLAAGDIASCGLRGDDATAAMLDERTGTVLTLGDNAYDDGTAAQYRDCYVPTWGRHLVRTRAALGNHDIRTADGGPTYDLFGVRAGPRDQGWHAFDLGPGWRVLVLNSNCPGTVSCAEGSPQYEWFRTRLEDAGERHVIVATHHPRWASGAYAPGETRVAALWRLAAQHGVDLWLAGHEHGYERFVPKDADGAGSDAGVQLLIAGTGGASLRPFGEPQPGSEVTVEAHGLLELTLQRDGYSWRFIDTDGAVRDHGTRTLG